MNNERRRRTTYFVNLGLFTSLVIIMTLITKIPIPQIKGYINLGDSMILLGTLIFGGNFGFLTGSFGSAFADIIGGYPNFAPFTFIIKGIEAYIFWFLIRKNNKIRLPLMISAAVIATFWMTAGYFITEYFMFGVTAAVAELPGNIIQALSSVAIGISLFKILKGKLPS